MESQIVRNSNVVRLYFIAAAAFIAALLILIVLTSGRAQAATINVAAGNDGTDLNGVCQLSEAMQNITDQAQTHADCLAGDGNNDTVQLAEGTITLTNDIVAANNHPVVIRGAGADKTVIDGVGQFLGLTISDPQTVVVVEDFHIKRTAGSHAIAITGLSQSVTIRQVEVSEVEFINSAIFVTGSYDTPHQATVLVEDIYAHDSQVDTENINGGPGSVFFTQFIFPVEVTVRRVTLANNRLTTGFSISLAESDGNVLQNSTLLFENNTVAMNESIAYDGSMGDVFLPIFATGYGNILADINIKNNTIVNNTSVADEIEGIKLGALGIFAVEEGKVIGKVQNNILAANTFAGQKSSCLFFPVHNGVVDVESLGHNISDDSTCESVFTAPGDQNAVDTLALMLKPIVAKKKTPITLASTVQTAAFNYDGSFAPVIALGAGSIAIDSGDCNNAPGIDQRFVVRPQGITCDVGSYEAVLAAVVTPGGVTDGSDGELANTGVLSGLAIALGAVMVFVAISTYIDYRRHRRPLYEEDPDVDYTYLHHIKVVTIPLAKYRISVTLQRGPSRPSSIRGA